MAWHSGGDAGGAEAAVASAGGEEAENGGDGGTHVMVVVTVAPLEWAVAVTPPFDPSAAPEDTTVDVVFVASARLRIRC